MRRRAARTIVARWTAVAATLTFCLVGIERPVAGATIPGFKLKKATLLVNDANRSARPKDRFDVRAEFERRSGGPSPNPALEPVTFSTGRFFRTVPAGAFLQSPADVGGTPRDTRWSYKERPDLRIVIVRSIAAGGTESWSLHARGEHVDLARTANPITTRLVIGDALGFQTLVFDAAVRDAKTRFRYPPGSETTDCGNGIPERGEVCDDGDLNSDVTPNACRTTCVRAGCGDGVVDSGEACDAGAANSDSVPDACRTDCTQPRCGDRVVDGGEDCDAGAGGEIGCCAAGCRFESAGHECRASAGVCDVAEQCDGASGQCPPDAFSPANAECRASAGACDAPETCTGTGPECPPDTKLTTECRPAAGPCDVAERCDGIADACPADGFAPSSVECRAGHGTCDPAEHCAGGAAACPPDAFATNGTTCDDANACTTGDACSNGVCRGHSPDCGDGTLQSACGEECDDGSANSDTIPNACRTTCVPAGCGDGVVDGGEACDDGNRLGGDRCSATCDDPDADADGVSVGQGDCNDADPAVHPGAADVCGDGIDQDCSGGDRSCSALELTITSPAAGAVLRAAPITVRGTVSDPNARVSVQNVLARITGTTFEAEGVVLFEGTNDLLARARDPRGAEATARESVVLDTVAPVLAVTSPADRAVLATAVVPVTGTVSDATAVTCTAGGAPAVVEGDTVTGQAALVGGTNTVVVSCRDAAGNEANRGLTLYLDAQPLAVTAIDPPNGAAGVGTSSDIRIAFSEPVAAGRIGATTFFARAGTAVLPGAVTVSPDGMEATLSPTALPAGSRIDVTVTTGVTDAAGNPLATPFQSRFSTAGDVAGAGVIAGEAYDDSRSLPLVGAAVEAIDPDTRAVLVESETDERGRYLLAAGRADVSIHVTKAGFTSVDRSLASQQGGLAEALDARLTPLATPVTLTAVFGGVVSDRVGDVLTIPPGGLDVDGPVGLTAVGAQGPRAPFPPGWSPLGIVEIASPAAFDPPATLAMRDGSGAAAGKNAVFASYDEIAATWVALSHATVPSDGSTILEHVAGSGQIALLLPDADAEGPPPVTDGGALPSGVATAIPDTAVGSGTVTPAVGRPDDASPATAAVAVVADTTLRSGSPLRGDFMELFVLRGGGQVAPLDTSQDMVAYRLPGDAEGRTLAATFAIAPSRTFGVADLSQGTITVTLLRGATLSRTLVGSEGGGVQVDDGSRLNVPSGALPGDVPVSLRRVEATSFPAIQVPGLALLGGLDLDLADVVTNAPVSLTLGGAAAGVPTGSQVVVAELRTILGRDRLVLVALGAIDGDGITTTTDADGVAFPGIRAGGRFGFYRVDGPLVGIGGIARESSGRRDGHVIEIAALPFVSVTDADGAFALVSPPGRFTLTATGATSHDQVTVEGNTGAALPEVLIGATPPRVVSITVRPPPLDGDFAGPVVLLGDPAPEIDDDSSGESRGNGNGVIEPGERIALTVAVRNDGTATTRSGTAVLRVASTGGSVTVLQPTVAVGPIAADESVAIGPFVFDAPAGRDPAQFRYMLALLTDSGLTNEIPFELPLGVDHPNVSVASEIAVRFSEPVTGADVAGSFTIAREDGGALVPVPVRVLAGSDGTTALARPLEQLADDAIYRITLTDGIVDQDRRPLDQAPVIERFRTEDRTPPRAIDPGRIEASVPDAGGFLTVSGSPGSVNPDDIVIVLDEVTGASVVATVAADGSFVARLRGDGTDQLTLIVRDRNGNELRISLGPLVRRDPISGEIVSMVLDQAGGTVTGPDPGIRLVVPAGALLGATEVGISRTSEPFELPADIAADPTLVDAFSALFSVVDRLAIEADGARFAAPVRLVLDPPADATTDDLFLAVRSRTVTLGGPLADVDLSTGLPAAQNPIRTVERLEILDSATIKEEGGSLVLSTDSPPFPGILEPGVVTILRARRRAVFITGEVRRNFDVGPPVPGAIVEPAAPHPATAAFVAVTDDDGLFTVLDPELTGPLADGVEVSSRLDVRDPLFLRVIRRTVRAVVGPPQPRRTTVALLVEPFVLPSTLPIGFRPILGDTDPPQVAVVVTGPSLTAGISRVDDPLTATVTATDDDVVSFLGLDVNNGTGFSSVQLGNDGRFVVTPSQPGLVSFRARAIDASGNSAVASAIVRVVDVPPPDPPPDPTRPPDPQNPPDPPPLPGSPPEIVSPPPNAVSFDGDVRVGFSEALDGTTVDTSSVRLIDPEGRAVLFDIAREDGGATLRLVPARNLRLGAAYRLSLSSTLRDTNGEPFGGATFTVAVHAPRQVALIAPRRAGDVTEDVALTCNGLVTVDHPPGVHAGDNGALHTFQVRDPFDVTKLLDQPVRLGSASLNGRPLALAVEGTLAFVGNRFLGPIATKRPFVAPFVPGVSSPPDILAGGACDPLSLIGFAGALCQGITFLWDSIPEPPSNLAVYDLTNPTNPQFRGAKVINYAGSDDRWNPNTWTDRVVSTPQGIAVLNFEENIEFFTPTEKPESLGVVGRVQGIGQELGRCGGDVSADFCGVDLACLGSDCLPQSQCPPNTPCRLSDEFLDAAFFDGFAVTLHSEALLALDTQQTRNRLAGGTLLASRSVPVGTSTFGARLGAVPQFAWGGGHVADLLFFVDRSNGLTIFDVTNGTRFDPLGALPGVVGNMSFDGDRAIAYLRGPGGEFHVVDFKDPTQPIELNDPGPGATPFSIAGLSSSYVFKKNVNRDGVVYAADDAGVAIVDLAAAFDPDFATRNIAGRCDLGDIAFFDALHGQDVEAAATDGAAVVRIDLELDPRSRAQLSPTDRIAFQIVEEGRTDPCPIGGLFTSMTSALDPRATGDTQIAVAPSGSPVSVYYRSPAQYACSSLDVRNSRLVSVRAAIAGGLPRALTKRAIRLERPPVLLVHGLNSNASMWADFPLVGSAASLLDRNALNGPIRGRGSIRSDGIDHEVPRFQFFAADYELYNQSVMILGRDSVQLQAAAMLEKLRKGRSAVEKFDVVAHSMGAPITRLLGGASGGPVRRFISLDGAHLGSMLADCLYDEKDATFAYKIGQCTQEISLGRVVRDAAIVLEPRRQDFVNSPLGALVGLFKPDALEALSHAIPMGGLDADGGAIGDLRTGQAFPLMSETLVHAIAGALDGDPQTRDIESQILIGAFGGARRILRDAAQDLAELALAGQNCGIGPILQTAEPRLVSNFSFDFIFGQRRGHDIALSTYSQTGGLTGFACTVFGGIDADVPPSCFPGKLEGEAQVTFKYPPVIGLQFTRNFGSKHLTAQAFPGRGVAESTAVALKVASLLDSNDVTRDFSRGFPASTAADQHGCGATPQVNLTIYSSQPTTSAQSLPVREDEETTIGAFTVANLNDTDGDGIADISDAGGVIGTPHGRDEVDLIRVRIDKPIPDNGGSLNLTVRSGNVRVRLWRTSTKAPGTEVTLVAGRREFPTSALPVDIWVEALDASSGLRDIVLEAAYQGASDTVVATAVWVDIEDVLHDASDSVWSGLPDPPATLFNVGMRGFGLFPIPFPPGFALNGIGFRFHVRPNDVWNQPNVAFDVTRQRDSREWRRDLGQQDFTVGPIATFGREEQPNDDTRDLTADPSDESATPDAAGNLYSLDTPGDIAAAPYFEEIIKANFLEFVRVRFDGGAAHPGQVEEGSRCSEKQSWHVRHHWVRFAGSKLRTTGDLQESPSNDIGPGHVVLDTSE